MLEIYPVLSVTVEPGIERGAFGIRHLAFGIWHLALSIWHLALGMEAAWRGRDTRFPAGRDYLLDAKYQMLRANSAGTGPATELAYRGPMLGHGNRNHNGNRTTLSGLNVEAWRPKPPGAPGQAW